MNKGLVAVATAGSVGLLGGAFLFQFAGYPPCQMCFWQRYPHAIAIFIGVVALALGARALAWLGALAAATTAAIGVYHTGVERDWWDGPASCTGGGGLTGDLLSTEGPRLVMCDQVSWALFGLSMASWNAVFSAVLVVIWISAALSKEGSSRTA